MAVTIRDLKDFQEMITVHQLQQEIWGLHDPNIGLYPPMLSTAAKNGGVVLGAFDDETERMIGFLFSFLGREPGGPLKLCSQIMGVRPEWRGQGIAESLKRVQRERTIAQDLPLITWTFDPLESPNAHLNLHKLRAISRTYWRDIYGSHFGQLNEGLPTDRLLVEWWVKGRRVEAPPADPGILDDAAPIFEIEGTGVDRWIARANLALEAGILQLEVLADLHPVKEQNIELALDWRLKVRNAFEKYFAKDYILVDLISTIERGERRNRYILQKSTPELLAELGI